MPIFLHCLDILRVNLYMLYKETSYVHPDIDNKKIHGHKDFLIKFINCLICRGNGETKCVVNNNVKRRVTTTPSSTDITVVHTGKVGKIVMSRKNPSLSPYDHVRYGSGEHILIKAEKQSKCKYCQYLVMVAKKRGTTLPVEERPRQKCLICNVHLCKKHMSIFHR